MSKMTYLVSVDCPLGGPSILFTGECEPQFRDSHTGYDFDGYMPTTIYRDDCELTGEGMTAKDWETFKYRLKNCIRERDVQHKPSEIVRAACKGTAAPVVISFDGGHESNARMVEIEALSEEM